MTTARFCAAWFVVVATVGIAWQSAGANQQKKDEKECFSSRKLEGRIGACTALIQSGHEPQAIVIAALGNRASAYARDGQYDRALDDYNQAIQLDSKQAPLFLGRGTTYALKGAYERAIEDYVQALRLDPDFAQVYVVRGLLFSKLGKAAQAAADFAKARQLNPYMPLP